VHFDAVAENLQATLRELKVAEPLVKQVIAIAASTRSDVLGR
jgi:hemoglobin